MRLVLVTSLFLLLAPPPAQGQTRTRATLGGAAGVNGASDRYYAGANVGATHQRGAFVFSADLEGHMFRRGNNGLYAFSLRRPNGFVGQTEVCINRRTLYAVAEGLCDGEYKPGAALSVDATYQIPGAAGFGLGAGGRIGAASTPYLLASYTVDVNPFASMSVEVQGSHRLLSLGGVLRFGSR